MCVAGFRIPGCSCDQEGAYQLKGALAAEETVQLRTVRACCTRAGLLPKTVGAP